MASVEDIGKTDGVVSSEHGLPGRIRRPRRRDHDGSVLRCAASLGKGFGADVRHVAGDRNELWPMRLQPVTKGGVKARERACAWGSSSRRSTPSGELRVGRRFARRAPARNPPVATAPDERFEDWLGCCPESKGAPWAHPFGATFRRRRSRASGGASIDGLGRTPGVAREARFELFDDAIELVLLNRAGDEVGHERP